MPKINVTANTFPDIVVAYLFDKLLHPEDVSSGNEQFNAFMEGFRKKGGMTIVRDYYLNMNPDNRRFYKLIKDVFEDLTSSNSMINILPERGDKPAVKAKKGKKGKKEAKPGFIKKIIKKAIKALIAGDELDDKDLEFLKEYIEEEDNG
jgi:hypothetical protein